MNDPNLSPDKAGTAGNGAAPDGTEDVRTRLAETERDRDKYLELARRTQADFENYQKRIQRDLQQERRYSAGALALELLPALDNLDRAMAAGKQAGESGPLVQGVSMVHSQLLDALKRHGITRIDSLHKTFDPSMHQAVSQQPSAEYPAGTILHVLQEGFMNHDRVLRPAAVVVSVALDSK
jgi:molecular chaperone GrpE